MKDWQLLAGWDVPGLTIEVNENQFGYHAIVHYRGSHESPNASSPPARHRAAAMLYVDALRAQGWRFVFENFIDKHGKTNMRITATHDDYDFYSEFASDHDNNEASTLLALLVQVKEAME